MHGTLRTAPHPDGRTGCGAALGLRDAPVGTLSHPSAICWRGWPSDPTRRGRRGPRVGAVGGRGRRRPSLPGEGVREGTARRRPRRDLPELGGCRPRCRARTRLRLGVGADPVDGLQLPVAGTVVLARVLSENNDLPPPAGTSPSAGSWSKTSGWRTLVANAPTLAWTSSSCLCLAQ